MLETKKKFAGLLKYITITIIVTGISLFSIGYPVNTVWSDSRGLFINAFYYCVILVSGLYKDPKVSIYTGFMTTAQYFILFCFCIFMKNIPVTGVYEIFNKQTLTWSNLFYKSCLFFCFSFFTAYFSFRIKNLLKRLLYSKVDESSKKQLKEVIENTGKQKTAFFINLAHEIKTPLTIIMNYLENYIKKNGTDNDLNIMKYNIRKLNRNIINFLDIEKLEQGKILYNHDRVINLKEILNNKLFMFADICEKKNLEFNYEKIIPDIFIKIDPFAIERIVNNIIDNAIRYTNPGGRVSVLTGINTKHVQFIVIDNGIGMQESHINNIFERFYRGSNEGHNTQGLGMGLNIVKCILNEVKACIEIKSEPGKGSEIIITFNRYYPGDNDMITCNTEISKPIEDFKKVEIEEIKYIEERHTILVVEDNYQMLSYIIENLKSNYNVFYAGNGREALVKLKRIPMPDLIISDVMMDEMNGYELYRKLFENDKYKSIPFIFLTGITDTNKKIEAIKKGAIDFISKPFLIEVLMVKIESIIKRQEELENKIMQSFIDRSMKLILGEIYRIKKDDNEKYFNFESRCFDYKITNREKDIIVLVMEGLQNKEISNVLKISENTVCGYLKNIYRKCDVQNRVELSNLFR